ncbi:hypothetical protein ACBQ20_17890 [Proteus vulgaris]|uniref:hypothetical protein n=1 Tax=Proteus TaxID=583 RepID=UPI0006597BEB|nr:hypothetical protein [Proteus vulgaris]CRL63741.1 hypothetical protein BN1805_02450 [Proteus vulgaris]
MRAKNEQLMFVVIMSIICGLAMFLIIIIFFFIGKCLIWWFVSGEFTFSYEYVKKAFRVGLITGPIAGVGTWFAEYKLRR